MIPMRILIVKPSALGDIVHAMVVVSELKRQYPDCVIDWIVGDRFFDIIDQSKIADRVLVYERHGNISSIFRLLSEIRQETYDYVFDMQGLARSGIMTYFAKAPHKIGRKDSRELSCLAYTETVDYPGPVHAVDILKEFLPVIGCNDEVSGIVSELKNIQSATFHTFLQEKIQNRPFVCLFPESQRRKKEWQYFPQLIEQLRQLVPGIVVLVMGNKNVPSISPHAHVLDLRAQTSIADIVYIIRHSHLVVANDSGPIHIAAALGRPALGLFIATDPSRSGPYPIYKESNVALRLNNVVTEIEFVAHTAAEMLSI